MNEFKTVRQIKMSPAEKEMILNNILHKEAFSFWKDPVGSLHSDIKYISTKIKSSYILAEDFVEDIFNKLVNK